MSCTRCHGAITVESYVDAEDNGYGLRWISAWRCVHCGQVPERNQARNTIESCRQAGSPAARLTRTHPESACPLATRVTV